MYIIKNELIVIKGVKILKKKFLWVAVRNPGPVGPVPPAPLWWYGM